MESDHPANGDSEHLRILTALAGGVHPLTGQPLPDDSVYQHAKVLRALQSAIEALKGKSRKKTKREGMPEQAGRSWSPIEIAQLVQGFDSGMSIEQLMQKHQRTRGGIESRLGKLGKIPVDPKWVEMDAERERKKQEKKNKSLLPLKPSSPSLLPPKNLPPHPPGKVLLSIPEEDIPF